MVARSAGGRDLPNGAEPAQDLLERGLPGGPRRDVCHWNAEQREEMGADDPGKGLAEPVPPDDVRTAGTRVRYACLGRGSFLGHAWCGTGQLRTDLPGPGGEVLDQLPQRLVIPAQENPPRPAEVLRVEAGLIEGGGDRADACLVLRPRPLP
jgi:hypothetical protein